MHNRQAHFASWKTSGINRETEGNLESTTEEEHRDAGLPLGKIRCLEPTQANSPTQAPLTKIHENPFKTAIEAKRIKKNEEAEESVST